MYCCYLAQLKKNIFFWGGGRTEEGVYSSRVTSTSPCLLHRKRINKIKNGRAGNVLAV